jgi:MFS superfamily sulfate permease-like transporter
MNTKCDFIQILIDIAAGIAASFLQFVFAMSFAAGCFAQSRTSSLFGIGVMMASQSAILTQIFYCWQSDIQYLFVSPDAFYVPLINKIALDLSNLIVDDITYQSTVIFAIVVCTFTVGCLQMIFGYFRLVQFADNIPYPAVCGLMAGIGINLIQIAATLFMKNNKISILNMVPGLIYALCNIISNHYRFSQITTFIILVVFSLFIFHSIVYFTGISFTKLAEDNWTFSSSNTLNYTWMLWTSNIPSIKHVDFNAIYFCQQQFLSIAILMVLKISLTIPAYEKVLKCRYDKSNELLKYGFGTAVASLFGSTGTSPSVSILSIVIEMGGSGRTPGFVAPLVLGLLYLTRFSFVFVAPKFIFSGF